MAPSGSPETAFKANANTEVCTDIILLRKLLPGEQPKGETWLNIGKTLTADMQEAKINEYFIRHPENIMGRSGDDRHNVSQGFADGDG